MKMVTKDEHLGLKLSLKHSLLLCESSVVLGNFVAHPLRQNTPEETIGFSKLHRVNYEAEYRIESMNSERCIQR
jgi:hypothetical protein